MRVLIAPDCFTGTLTAPEAAAAMATGWRRHAPADELELCPLSDGGPGFVDVLHAALGGRLLSVTVTGPLGEPTPAALLLVGETAYLESAQACGSHLIPAQRRDPGLSTTYGVGELIVAAREAGARRIVVGLGGSGTNDAGAGMLAGLGGSLDEATAGRLRGGGAALRGITIEDLAGLAPVLEAWRDVELVVASDIDSPLLGMHGASAGFAEQKGASKEQAQELERCLGDFAASAVRALPVAPKLAAAAGAGAAGGLGFGLLLLGATRTSGAQAVVDHVGLPARIGAADLVITGEGSFDWQSLRGKVTTAVAKAALSVGTPTVVLAGQVKVGRREALSIGVESAYPVARDADEIRLALLDPVGTLAARAERIARTWSH